MRFFTALLILAAVLTGCEQATNQADIEKLTRDLDDAVKNAGDAFKRLTTQSKEVPDLAQKEVEKLFTFEYRVVELESSSSPQELQEELEELGQDRWECFHAEPTGNVLRFFCKRRPKTYLRYIPRFM